MSEIVTTERLSVTAAIARRYNMEADKFKQMVMATCFPANPPATPEEFAAGMQIAYRLELNPITKEVHFARTKGGGIQAIIGVDGWYTMANRHPQYDGCEFSFEWTTGDNRKLVAATCRIFRKDRSHPDEVTEFMAECQRPSEAWRLTPSRMLRHRAFGQCARIAFAFAGVMDADEFGKWQEEDEIRPAKRKSSAEGKRDGSAKAFAELQPKITKAATKADCLKAWIKNRRFLETVARGWFETLCQDFIYRMRDFGETIEVDDNSWPIISNELLQCLGDDPEYIDDGTEENDASEESEVVTAEELQPLQPRDTLASQAEPLDQEAAEAALHGFTTALGAAHSLNMITRLWNRWDKARGECSPAYQAKFEAARAQAMKRVKAAPSQLQAAE